MPSLTRALYVVVLCLNAAVVPAAAQESVAGSMHTFDERMLLQVYGTDAAFFRGAMRAADATAYPLFAGVPAATFAFAYAFDGPDARPAAYRVAASEAIALAGAVVLKHVYGRRRPYAVMNNVTSRAAGLDRLLLAHDTLSFPSAHAALSFAIASSLSLSYPKWYVIAPAFLWAASVSTSRMWMGLHYPTDVLSGLLIGTAAGVGVHLLEHYLIPPWLPGAGASSIKVRIAFGL